MTMDTPVTQSPPISKSGINATYGRVLVERAYTGTHVTCPYTVRHPETRSLVPSQLGAAAKRSGTDDQAKWNSMSHKSTSKAPLHSWLFSLWSPGIQGKRQVSEDN